MYDFMDLILGIGDTYALNVLADLIEELQRLRAEKFTLIHTKLGNISIDSFWVRDLPLIARVIGVVVRRRIGFWCWGG